MQWREKRRRAGNWGTYSSLSLLWYGKVCISVTSRGGPCVHSKINSRSINLVLVASWWYAVDILPWIQAYFFDFLFSKKYQKDKSRWMWEPILFSRWLCQMVIHVQYVEIGNRRHLEKILALQDTTKNMEKEKSVYVPKQPANRP